VKDPSQTLHNAHHADEDLTVQMQESAGPLVVDRPTAGDDDLVAAKRALRTRIRAERRSRPSRQQGSVADALVSVVLEIPEIATAEVVALYASVPGEPGTGPLRAALRSAGVRVLLPVVLPDDDLTWAVDDGRTVPPAAKGGPVPATEPLGTDALATADAVLVPALAVDTLGHRLGQGGGSYDRSLRRAHPAAAVVALVHDEELLDAAVEPVPAQAHDVRAGLVATPTRWLRLS
jgi:5-formyltetrahydrofolate cyclo-ligase